MKMFRLVLVAMLLAAVRLSAQVSLEVDMGQDEFLPAESIPVAVHITNRSGQPLHLGADPGWLTFNIESADGFIVVKRSEVPVSGAFDLPSMDTAIKRVDLQPYFGLNRPGLYRVTATLRINNWNFETTSPVQRFNIVSGAKIWSQVFGVPAASNAVPEVRKYILEKANYLESQLRLYCVVTDETQTHVFKVTRIGGVVSFSQPEAQLDRASNLHILYQNGGRTFLYSVVNPNGDLLRQEVYDYLNTRPRLGLDDQGNIVVIGGVRRVLPTTVPDVKSPDELVAPKK